MAVNEVNEKTDIDVSYTQQKRGRAVTGFKFTIKTKKATETPKTPKNELKDVNTVDMFTNMTEKQIETFSRKLASMPELGSHAPIGASMEQFALMLADNLRDPYKRQSLKPYLQKLGFKGFRGVPLTSDKTPNRGALSVLAN